MAFANFWAQQFVDESGLPYGGVKVYHYEPGTTTDKSVWTDRFKSATANQPVQGDSRGMVSFYGDGRYRLRVVSNDDILLYDWDNVDAMGTPVGTESRVPFYDAAGLLTDSADLSYDTTNKRLGLGTSTNITERLVVPNNSYFAGERSIASTSEGARRIIGISSSDKISLDADGLGTILGGVVPSGILYVDANNQIRVLTLTNGQVPIGYSGNNPVAATPISTGALSIAPGAGSLTFTPTADAPTVVDRTNTAKTVANTTDETSLYGFTMPANNMSTNKSVAIRMGGTYGNSSGATKTINFRIVFGGTEMYQDVTPAFANGLTCAWHVDLMLCNQTATAQVLYGNVGFSTTTTAITGVGSDITATFFTILHGTAAENTANALRFDFYITHSGAHAATTISCTYANAILQ